MEFVSDVPSGENFVESLRSDLKAVIVLVAAVKVDMQSREIRGTGQGEWTLLFPEGLIERVSENTAENPVHRPECRRVCG